MAHTCSPTVMRNSRGKIRSRSILSGSRHATFGAMAPVRAIPSVSICGRTILMRPDGVAAFAATQGLPRGADGPVFAEPWQAEAFALAVRLSDAGFFTWREWADELAAVLREATTRERPDDGSHYYDHWLFALE